MKTLVLYDISSDKERKKIADLCLDYGLERNQKSVYLGELNQWLNTQLVKELRAKIPKSKSSIAVYLIDSFSEKRKLIFEVKRRE